MTAIDDIAAERLRQVHQEGWSEQHDDTHTLGEMAEAAAAYAVRAADNNEVFAALGRRPLHAKSNAGYVTLSGLLWPWDRRWWKPTNPRRDLVKAAALIVAEIERLDRAEARKAA